MGAVCKQGFGVGLKFLAVGAIDGYITALELHVSLWMKKSVVNVSLP